MSDSKEMDRHLNWWLEMEQPTAKELLLTEVTAFYRIRHLAGQLYAACDMGSWCFDAKGELYFAISEAQQEYLMFFKLGGCLEYALEHLKECESPMLLTDALDMLWIADMAQEDGGNPLLVVLGPVFNSRSSVQTLEEQLRNMNVSLRIRSTLLEKLQTVPVLSYPSIVQYTKMLHYTITGDTVDPSSFQYQVAGQKAVALTVEEEQRVFPERARANEEILLQLVREGNVHAKSIKDRIVTFSGYDTYATGAPQRDAKNNVLIFTALCARAAIDGGLTPKIAKDLEIHYISCVEKCSRMADLISLSNTMMQDFVQRVHRCKTGPALSRPIQECCAFIENHLDQSFRLEDLAKEVGYTEYYLTKKFHREMGIRLVEYIKYARIEKAKIRLLTTQTSIEQIAEEFQFGTRTYFTRVFREQTGMTPAKFRETNGKGDQ